MTFKYGILVPKEISIISFIYVVFCFLFVLFVCLFVCFSQGMAKKCMKVLKPRVHDKIPYFCSTNLHICNVFVDAITLNFLKFLTRNFQRHEDNLRWLFVADFLTENFPLAISIFQGKFISFSCLYIYILFANLQFHWVPFKRFLRHPAGHQSERGNQCDLRFPPKLAKLPWCPLTWAQEVSFHGA